MKLELYKVFNEISSRMRASEIKFIIEKLSERELPKIINEEVELVHELARRSKSSESTYGELAVNYMWKIAFSDSR